MINMYLLICYAIDAIAVLVLCLFCLRTKEFSLNQSEA